MLGLERVADSLETSDAGFREAPVARLPERFEPALDLGTRVRRFGATPNPPPSLPVAPPPGEAGLARGG
ncbi:MAG: hypothetical protein SFW67_31075 [Myxococcaceae bacterium]|nr:hypothetical protein [Myxococcaceae bacterium]